VRRSAEITFTPFTESPLEKGKSLPTDPLLATPVSHNSPKLTFTLTLMIMMTESNTGDAYASRSRRWNCSRKTTDGDEWRRGEEGSRENRNNHAKPCGDRCDHSVRAWQPTPTNSDSNHKRGATDNTTITTSTFNPQEERTTTLQGTSRI